MNLFKNFIANKQNLLVAILLGIILVLSLFVRFYNLTNIPSGFHIDEAIIADNAYSIMKTGKDTDNNFLPLQTEQFGDYNPTGYAYLAILPIKFLGLTIFAARSVGAVLSVLTVLGVFFLTYAFFERKNLSLLTALFVALSPWDIVLSRSTEETVSALVFIVFGFAFLIWGIKKERIRYLLLATILLFISYFMYFTPRLFVPLLLLAFFIPVKYWYAKRKTLFTKVFIGCFLLLSVIALFLVVGVKGGASRANQVSIFGFPETQLVMAEQIREDGIQDTPVLITHLFHNKPLAYSITFARNYLQYFSGGFLFTDGGLPIWFKVPQMGLMYLVELPFILYGLYWFFREKRSWSFIVIIWLLLAPVIAALTVDDIPNVRRALIMVPVLEMLAAYGVLAAYKNIPKKIQKVAVILFIVIFSFNSLYFFHEYFVHSPIHQNWYRNAGFGEMVATVQKDYQNYDKIIVTKSLGGIYPLILFYTKYDPATYQQEGFPKDKAYGGFGKFFFAEASCPSKDRDSRFPNVRKTIYVDNGDCPDYPALNKLEHTYIVGKDGVRIFRIVYE
jgi:hypothetical protein